MDKADIEEDTINYKGKSLQLSKILQIHFYYFLIKTKIKYFLL